MKVFQRHAEVFFDVNLVVPGWNSNSLACENKIFAQHLRKFIMIFGIVRHDFHFVSPYRTIAMLLPQARSRDEAPPYVAALH